MWISSRTASYLKEALACLAVGMVAVLVLNSFIRMVSAPEQNPRPEEMTYSQANLQDDSVKPPPTPVSRSASVMHFE